MQSSFNVIKAPSASVDGTKNIKTKYNSSRTENSSNYVENEVLHFYEEQGRSLVAQHKKLAEEIISSAQKEASELKEKNKKILKL